MSKAQMLSWDGDDRPKPAMGYQVFIDDKLVACVQTPEARDAAVRLMRIEDTAALQKGSGR